MKQLWKGLAVLTMIGLLHVGGGTAQAVVGIPDDVPGNTLLFPFFKVTPAPTPSSRQDTLIVITNASSILAEAHFTIWDIRSAHVYDFNVLVSPHDVYSCSLLDLFLSPQACAQAVQAPPSVIPALTTTVAGQTILSGYVTVDALPGVTSLFPGQPDYPLADCNIFVGHEYLVNLVSGSSSGFNAVSIEHTLAKKGQPAPAFIGGNTVGFYLNKCIEIQGGPCPYDLLERIDAPNGDIAQTGTNDTPGLDLIVRYFTLSSINARTEIWVWKDRNTDDASGQVSLAVYDEDENLHSTTVNMPNEVNAIDPVDLISPGAPGGWFRIKFLNSQFNSSGPPIQAVAYSLQFANSQNASLRWDAVFPADRQYTDYINGTSEE